MRDEGKGWTLVTGLVVVAVVVMHLLTIRECHAKSCSGQLRPSLHNGVCICVEVAK